MSDEETVQRLRAIITKHEQLADQHLRDAGYEYSASKLDAWEPDERAIRDYAWADGARSALRMLTGTPKQRASELYWLEKMLDA